MKTKFSERFDRLCKSIDIAPNSGDGHAIFEAIRLERRLARVSARKKEHGLSKSDEGWLKSSARERIETLEQTARDYQDALKTIGDTRTAFGKFIGGTERIQTAAYRAAGNLSFVEQQNAATIVAFGTFLSDSELISAAVSRAMSRIKLLETERDEARAELAKATRSRLNASLIKPSSLREKQRIVWHRNNVVYDGSVTQVFEYHADVLSGGAVYCLYDIQAAQLAIRVVVKVPDEFINQWRRSRNDHSSECSDLPNDCGCLASCPIAIAWREAGSPQ